MIFHGICVSTANEPHSFSILHFPGEGDPDPMPLPQDPRMTRVTACLNMYSLMLDSFGRTTIVLTSDTARIYLRTMILVSVYRICPKEQVKSFRHILLF